MAQSRSTTGKDGEAPATVGQSRMIRVDMESYLSKHEIVYQAPPLQGWEGFPVGNGSYGGMLWAQKEGLVFQANHTDLLELPDPEEQNEGWAVLRACGRLAVKHPFPMHDWLYINQYQASLSLYRSEVRSHCDSAFGTFDTRFFVHAGRPVAVLDYSAHYRGPLEQKGAPVEIEVERWGSRIFGWWYTRIQGGAGMDIGEARVDILDGDICLRAFFRGVDVVLRCRVLGGNTDAQIVHARQGKFTVQASPRHSLTILLACVTSKESTDPVQDAKAHLDEISFEGSRAQTDKEHASWWASYWDRSFLSIPRDYVENLYYLHLYLMGTSCRGNLPPLFNGGIWLWNHDVRNWVNPHHWNQQQSFWCLPAANRCEMLMPFLNTYHSLMPQAKKATIECGYQGLRWSEMHDYTGRQMGLQSHSFKLNHTPAAQIAMMFWWHYRFSGDADYLITHGFDFLNGVGDFYLDFIKWSDKLGRYEIPIASTYEDERPWRFSDTITNVTMAKRVLQILLYLWETLRDAIQVDEEKVSRWKHMLENLPPYMVNHRDTERGPTLASGLVDGKEFPEQENHNHGPLFCPIIPAGDLGLKDRGSEVFSAAYNTLATYPPAVLAITPTVVVAARLGNVEQAQSRITNMVRNLQHFPNGLFFNIDHWYYLSRRTVDDIQIRSSHEYWKGRNYSIDDRAQFQRDYLEDAKAGFKEVRVLSHGSDGVAEHNADVPPAPFSQMGMESLGSMTAGIQEMVLQSHEGGIRVFPAVPDGWTGAFSLLAEGGFLVTARKKAHESPQWIEIISTLGGDCVVFAPWPEYRVLRIDRKEEGEEITSITGTIGPDATLSFPTEPGGIYLAGENIARLPDRVEFSGVPNSRPKQCFEARLGLTSQW